MAGAIVQSQAAFSSSSNQNIQVTLTGTTAGNSIWVVGHDGNASGINLTCADNVNGTYGTALDTINDTTNGNTVRHWVKANIAGGTVVVTVTSPGFDVFKGIYAVEVSGVATAPTDGHSGRTQSVANGGAITSNSGTNTATAFMLSCTIDDSSTTAGHGTVGTGFTVDPNFASGFWSFGTGNNAITEYKASVAAAANSSTFTNGTGGTQTFNTLMVMLDESGGGGSPVTVSPPAGSLSLTGEVPTVTTTANQLVKPPAGALILSGQVPTVIATANQTVKPPAGALTLTGLVPIVRTGANTVVAPPAGSLTLTGKVPTVALSSNQLIKPPAGSLSVTGLVPSILITQNVLIHAPVGALSLTGLAPTIEGTVVPVIPIGPTPAGRRRRYFVEIDGVRFDVRDAEQARQILERAKTLAREAAEQSADIIQRAHRITTETIAPVKLAAPRVTASPELRLPLKSVRRSINKIYREKSVIVELRMWLELEQRLMDDDDEAMLLLN